MQPGASFAIDGACGVCRLSTAGGFAMQIGNHTQQFDHAADEISDLSTCDARVVGLYVAEGGQTLLVQGELVRRRVHVTMTRPVPASVRRVAVTRGRWWLAGDDELHAIDEHTGPLELVTMDAIDMAASLTELCVVDERGLTWFDDRCKVVHRQSLDAPTAVMHDARGGGWIIAAGGDVLQLADARATPVVLARDVGLVTRVRRDFDTLYAMCDSGELVEVMGIRHGPTTNEARVIATYPPGFAQFDAYERLWVHAPDSVFPRWFYVQTECGCRTRTVQLVDEWSERGGDATDERYQRVRCPICRTEWTEQIG